MVRETLTLITSDDLHLEAELVSPDQPTGAAVVAHPHPLHGGNMRSMVPGELIEALPASGFATLRFNFRGVGNSQGVHDHGLGEQLDVLSAIDTLHEVAEGLPLILFGSSFGADTALGVTHEAITAWCACAPPLREEKRDGFAAVASDSRAKLLIVAERDNFCPPDQVATITENWTNTTTRVVKGADHYFVGRIGEVTQQCVGFASSFTG